MSEPQDGQEGCQLKPSDVKLFVGQRRRVLVQNCSVPRGEIIAADRTRHDERISDDSIIQCAGDDGLQTFPARVDLREVEERRRMRNGDGAGHSEQVHRLRDATHENRFVVVGIEQRLLTLVEARHVVRRSELEVERVD